MPCMFASSASTVTKCHPSAGYASLLDNPLRIPCHFPQMPVWVLEVARVTAPKGVVRRLYHDGTRLFGLFHHRVDFGLRGDVVPDGEVGRVGFAKSDPRIASNALSGPQRELQTGLQVEESDCAILELRADDAFGLEAKTVAVEPDCLLQIVDAKSDERNPRLHARFRRKTWVARSPATDFAHS